MRIKLFVLMILCIHVSLAFSKQKQKISTPNSEEEMYNVFDINKIIMTVKNNGIFAEHFYGDKWYRGFEYEKTDFICSSGFWLAALVDDSARAAISMFGSSDFTHGIINDEGSHFGENDSLKFRVYKIQQGDTPLSNSDYNDWPANFGAPTDDLGYPLILGDQTLWCTFTDTYYPNRWYNPSNELGAEVHLMVWGWKEISNVIFLHWDIINKSKKKWKDAFGGFFVDPDMKFAHDDLVGSDSTVNMVYCYEGSQGERGKTFQSLGFVFAETPHTQSTGDTAITLNGWKDNFKNVPASSPLIFKHYPEEWVEDVFRSGQFTKNLVYDRLNCKDKFGNPMKDPTTANITRWAYSGDPITQTGWIEEEKFRDQRMMISAGPFDVAVGDTAAFTLAIIAVQIPDRLANIVRLKQNARFLQMFFNNQFEILADADVEVNFISPNEREIKVTVPIKTDISIYSVQAAFYNYNDEPLNILELFDDGSHSDKGANDNVFGNVWQTISMDDALYLNVKITDEFGEQYNIKQAAEYITLSNKIDFDIAVVADSKNFDGEVNPGENIRLILGVKNNYHFDIGRLSIAVTSEDSFFNFNSASYLLDSVAAGGYTQMNYDPADRHSYLEFNVSADIPDNHKIVFDLNIYDDKHHHWTNTITVPVRPFEYLPNEMIPSQVSGRSDGYFVVRVVDPACLTGHSYSLTFNDSLPDVGFNLIDLTLDKHILQNNPLPDKYAYNIPVTDGFKVVEAYFTEGGLQDAYYEDVEAGHPAGFEGVNYGGRFFYGGVVLGQASDENFYQVEIEFTNDIDTSGIAGTAAGQDGFRYLLGASGGATLFVPCPFNIWKIFKGERIGRLNACFQENPYFPTNDNVWAPDASDYGGLEILNIMTTEYDPTGQLYLGKELDMNEVMYRCVFRLISENSVVDAGDKFILKWEHPVTSEDKWAFVPTNVIEKNVELPNSFQLYQNYPNPFNPTTTIKFSIEDPSQVSLEIYNIMGQEIVELINKNFSKGIHSVQWDGNNKFGQSVSSGLYFAKLISNKKSKLIKMLLIR